MSDRSPFACLLEALIPLLLVLVFVFGIPFGYRVVLGHRNTPRVSGRVERVAFADERDARAFVGMPVSVLSRHVVFERDGREIWVPDALVIELEIGAE